MARKKTQSVSREHLSLNLKYVRTLNGWSQEQLGLECDLKRTYIGALERGEVNPGIDNVDCIALALGVPGHVLIQDPKEAHPTFFGLAKTALPVPVKIDLPRLAGKKVDGDGRFPRR